MYFLALFSNFMHHFLADVFLVLLLVLKIVNPNCNELAMRWVYLSIMCEKLIYKSSWLYDVLVQYKLISTKYNF